MRSLELYNDKEEVMALLKVGSKGDEVASLQSDLKQLGFGIENDGIFGPATKEAVEELQMAFGYDVDGIVGDGTRSLVAKQLGYNWDINNGSAIKAALEAQGKTNDSGSLAGAPLARLLKKGTNGADVRYLQRRLNALGYTIGASGDF